MEGVAAAEVASSVLMPASSTQATLRLPLRAPHSFLLLVVNEDPSSVALRTDARGGVPETWETSRRFSQRNSWKTTRYVIGKGDGRRP